MSFTLLYDSMEKTIWDKKLKEFVRKEVIALCNSIGCAARLPYKKDSRKWRKYDLFKYVKKDVSANCTTCPDCGSVLVWKEPEKVPDMLLS